MPDDLCAVECDGSCCACRFNSRELGRRILSAFVMWPRVDAGLASTARQRACTDARRVAGSVVSSLGPVVDRHVRRQARLRSSTIADNTYNAAHLLVLEGLEAVRKRPGMYIGSTDTRGLMHCLWEIIDNAVDEALAGVCDQIEVILHPDGSVEVRDDGRGIPVDKEPKTGLSGVEVVFTKLHAGGKFGGGSYVATGGLHGVGASVVNALSARLDVEVDRTPAHAGHVVPARRARACSPATARTRRSRQKSGLPARAAGSTKGVTGTRIRFWPDRQIFTKDAHVRRSTSWSRRARQTSFLVPGLELVIRDVRGDAAGRGDVPARRRHRGVLRVPGATTSRSPTSCGCRAPTRSPRPCRCSTTRAT